MASVNGLGLGSPIPICNNDYAYTYEFSLDATGDRIAAVFAMPEAATITHGLFRYNLRTGTPPTYRISLQSLTTAGLPSGTILASATFTPPASTAWDGTVQTVAFSASVALTAGQIVAWVIDYSSGTIDASNYSQFTYIFAGIFSTRPGLPYLLSDTSGTWTKSTNAFPWYGIRSASKTYGMPLLNVFKAATVSTSGHRATKKVKLPSGSCSTFSVMGLRFYATPPATGNTWTIGIWNDAGTVVADLASVDSDWTASDVAYRPYEFYFDETAPTLTVDTFYYAGIQSTGSAITLYTLELTAAVDRTAFPLGDNCSLATWDGSAWTETTTQLPIVELILSDISFTAGGGETPAQIIIQKAS